MKTTTTFASKFAEQKGAFCMFPTKEKNVNVLYLFPDKGVSTPVKIVVNNKKKLFYFNADIGYDQYTKYSKIVQYVLLDYGITDEYELAIKDFDLLPEGRMIARKLAMGFVDYSEEDYLRFIYGDVPSAATAPSLHVEESVSYAPFADIVKSYDSLPERDYVLTNSENRLLESIKCGKVKTALLQGYPGTGKTSLAKAIATKLGLPFKQLVGKCATTEEILGGFGCKADGNVGFIPGILLECYEHGGMIIWDEINATHPNFLTPVYGMIDGSKYYVEKNTNRVIKKHDNFVFIATMNPDQGGAVYDLPSALYSRFDVVLNYPKPTKADIKSKLLNKYPLYSDILLDKIAAIIEMVDNNSVNNGYGGTCSIRQAENLLDNCYNLAMSYEDFREVFESTVLNPVFSNNPKDIETRIKETKDYLNSELVSDYLKAIYTASQPVMAPSIDYEWAVDACGLSPKTTAETESACPPADAKSELGDISSSVSDFSDALKTAIEGGKM